MNEPGEANLEHQPDDSLAEDGSQEERASANEMIALETRRQATRWGFLVRIWSLVIASVVVIGGLIAGVVLAVTDGWSSASLVSFVVALAGLVAVIYGNVRRDVQSPPGA